MHVGQVGDEVVADEEAHEDPVVDDVLHVVEGQVAQLLKLVVQILAQQAQVQQVEGRLLRGRRSLRSLNIVSFFIELSRCVVLEYFCRYRME